MNRRRHLLIIAVLCLACRLNGQSPAALGAGNSNRPHLAVPSIDKEPNLDGEVLNDPVWMQISPFGDLLQNQPNFGRPASEKTEIRIFYTKETFFLSVVCYDSEPSKLVVSDARRDASLDNTDSFQFILDTYNDNRNGFVFGTNPIGVEYDAQVDNEGQGNFNANRQQGGVIGGFNINWDAAWVVKATIGEYGWSAEFAIPFRTLRYLSGDNQVWGANFQRNIRKTNEVVYWAQIPIGLTLNRLSMAGKLTGLNLKSPGNLKLIPYVLGKASKNYEEIDPKTKINGEAGVDLKYSVTPSMTLDLTYNTDFAQVEVDDEQVNLDRFNLFFPEKRPFFLENAGLFTVGSPGEVDLFFSRRIGIGPAGDLVPIIGGARLSGKVNRTNIGFLSMFTDDVPGADVDENNFTVARVNQEFARRSSIGAAFINKQGMGEGSSQYNRVFATDAKIGLGNMAQLSGFYARSNTPGISDGQHAFKGQASYNWNQWELNLAYTEVAEGFNPEMGFLLRQAFKKPEALVLYHIRPKEGNKMGFLELRPHVSYRGYWNFQGFQETGFLHIDNHWEWKSGIELHTGINFTTEGVVEDFEISKGVVVPAGTYKHSEAQIVFMTNGSKNIYLNTRSVLGGFFGGTRLANSGTIGVRFGDKFNSEFSLISNIIDLPFGDFTANILRARLSYSFTPRLYVQSLIQNNSSSDVWSANIRLGWLQQSNTGLFVVFNQTNKNGPLGNRSFAVKYTRVFDILK